MLFERPGNNLSLRHSPERKVYGLLGESPPGGLLIRIKI
jgi:hypothetical protein